MRRSFLYLMLTCLLGPLSAQSLTTEDPLFRGAIEGTASELAVALQDHPSPLARTVSGKTALHLAAEFNPDPEVALLLLGSGWDLEARDHEGRTPLMGAARRNTAPVAEALLRAGASAQARDSDGRTASDWSSGNPRLTALPVVRTLAEAVYR